LNTTQFLLSFDICYNENGCRPTAGKIGYILLPAYRPVKKLANMLAESMVKLVKNAVDRLINVPAPTRTRTTK
jgi:hypothetical protein